LFNADSKKILILLTKIVAIGSLIAGILGVVLPPGQ
jgi:hypothetical protein